MFIAALSQNKCIFQETKEGICSWKLSSSSSLYHGVYKTELHWHILYTFPGFLLKHQLATCIHFCVFFSFSGLTVEGQWLEWGPWSKCSVTCNTGTQQRQRRCSSSVHGWAECKGLHEESRECTNPSCSGKELKSFASIGGWQLFRHTGIFWVGTSSGEAELMVF